MIQKISTSASFSQAPQTVFVFAGIKKKPEVFSDVNDIRNIILPFFTTREFNPKQNSIITFYKQNQYNQVVYLGIDAKNKAEGLREAVHTGIKSLANNTTIEIDVSDIKTIAKYLSIDESTVATSIVEGLVLSEYDFGKYRAQDPQNPPKKHKVVFNQNKTEIKKAVEIARIVSEGTLLARDLGHEPANKLDPSIFVRRARELSKKSSFTCTVLDKAELVRKKMNGILGVGEGSAIPPRLLITEYKPKSKNSKKSFKKILIVGKGITFDSGGISIKPSNAMEEMKFDMCGAAVALATMYTVSRLNLNIHLIAAMPLAENMPSGTAIKPSDVLTMYSGKTVAVNNTDAEGRLVLADALNYCIKKYKPDHTIDFATLTGACIVALGYNYAGLMGNDQSLIDGLLESGKEVNENLWQLPLTEDFLELIKSPYADISNIGCDRGAGTITAGKFLEQFVEEQSWCHIDIAGVNITPREKFYKPKGATGFGVRLMIDFLTKTLK